MKRLSIYILFACLAWTQSQAQDIVTLFSSMPEKMLIPLDSLQRLDMVDFYKAGKLAQTVSHLNDTCVLKSLSDDYLYLKTGNASIELILLPMVNNSKIICEIKTVCAPACDSHIEFYTTEWEGLDSKLFINPVPDKWFIKDGVDINDNSFKNFESLLNISLMHYQFDRDHLTLSQTYTIPQYLGLTDRKKADTYLKSEPKIYTWNKVRFE